MSRHVGLRTGRWSTFSSRVACRCNFSTSMHLHCCLLTNSPVMPCALSVPGTAGMRLPFLAWRGEGCDPSATGASCAWLISCGLKRANVNLTALVLQTITCFLSGSFAVWPSCCCNQCCWNCMPHLGDSVGSLSALPPRIIGALPLRASSLCLQVQQSSSASPEVKEEKGIGSTDSARKRSRHRLLLKTFQLAASSLAGSLIGGTPFASQHCTAAH